MTNELQKFKIWFEHTYKSGEKNEYKLFITKYGKCITYSSGRGIYVYAYRYASKSLTQFYLCANLKVKHLNLKIDLPRAPCNLLGIVDYIFLCCMILILSFFYLWLVRNRVCIACAQNAYTILHICLIVYIFHCYRV